MRVETRLAALGLRFASAAIEGVRVTTLASSSRQRWLNRVSALRTAMSEAPIAASAEVTALHSVYASLGIGLRHGRPSIERVGGALAKGRDLPEINAVADVYNLASIEHRLCMGAHDLDLLALPIDLRLTTGTESFTPLGGQPEPVRPGEFAYVDGAGRVICRLDALQAEFSKVTAVTRTVLLIVEAAAPTSDTLLREATERTAAEIASAAGGTVRSVALAVPTTFQ